MVSPLDSIHTLRFFAESASNILAYHSATNDVREKNLLVESAKNLVDAIRNRIDKDVIKEQ